MKRVDSVTISFPQKNDLPLTNNPGERNESIKQAILFCSHHHLNAAHLIQSMMFKSLFRQNYYCFTKRVWSLQHHTFERLSQSFSTTKEHTALNRPGEEKPFNAII